MEGAMFWLSVLLIVLFSVLGGLLFKYGTENLGSISLQRLFEIEFSGRFWLHVGLMFLGLSLFIYGGWSLREDVFAMRYLFSPIVFGALALMFVSRFLVGVPLSVTGLGRLSSITTSLMLIATTVSSILLFNERFDVRIITGILMSVVAVVLLGWK